MQNGQVIIKIVNLRNSFVIENPEKEGELIHTNSAKVKDIKWNEVKYGIIPSESSIMPDGTWYDENAGTCIKVHKDKEQKNNIRKKAYRRSSN